MRRSLFVITGLAALLPATAWGRWGMRVHVGLPRVEIVTRAPCPGPGWVWVEGHPGPYGRWVSAHWEYRGVPPRSGWVYVSGYWSEGAWVPGFWRPPLLVGYHWREAFVSPDGVWVPGYWQPEGPPPPGMAWRPGYWDGRRWIPGAWVPAAEVENGGYPPQGSPPPLPNEAQEEVAIPDGGRSQDTAAPLPSDQAPSDQAPSDQAPYDQAPSDQAPDTQRPPPPPPAEQPPSDAHSRHHDVPD
jgi:hypothetical protein